MAGEPYITVVGNMAGDPELRWTASGHAVASFTIAQTPRSYDKATQQYVDDETLWVRASVWREQAENVAQSLVKGMRVIAHGRLQARSFEDKQGNQRTNWELQVDEVAPSLRWATAQVNRMGQSQSGYNNTPQESSAPGGAWGAPAASPGGAWSGGQAQGQGQSQAPPF